MIKPLHCLKISVLFSFIFLLISFSGYTQDKSLYLTKDSSFVKIGDLDIQGDQLTVEARVKLDKITALDIVSKHSGPPNVNYLLRPGWGQITTYDDPNQNSGTGSATHYSSNIPIPSDTVPPVNTSLVGTGSCYHFAMVYDGQSLRAYINGCLVDSVPASGNLYQNDFETRIGAYAGPANNEGAEQFWGLIDEVRIWNVARTEAQIKQFMSTSLPSPASQSGLQAYYDFNTDYKNKQGNTQWDGIPHYSKGIPTTGPTVDPPVGSGLERTDKVCTITPFKINPNVIGNLEFCDGDSVLFEANPNWPDSKVYWSTGDTTNSITVTTSQPISVTVISKLGCVLTDGPVNVISNDRPTIDADPDKKYCLGDTVRIHAQATGGDGDYTYSWTSSDGLSCNNCQTIERVSTSNRTYYPHVIDGNGCANSNKDSMKVTINGLPSVVALADTSVCSGDTVTIDATASGGDGNYSYKWVSSPAGLGCTDCNPAKLATTTPRDYIVTVTDGNGCKSASDTMGVEILALPQLNNLADQDVCLEDQFQIAGDAIGGDSTYAYVWSTDTGVVCTDCDTLIGIVDTTRSYYVQVIDGNTCSGKMDTVVVNALENPQGNAIPDNDICYGDSISLHVTVSGGKAPYSYSWSPASGLSCDDCGTPKASPDSSTIYEVLITDSNGCFNREPVKSPLTVFPLPAADAGLDTEICTGDSAALSGSGGNVYLWSSAETLDDPKSANPVASPKKTTEYNLLVTDGNGCQNYDTVVVKVHSLPLADAGPDGVMCIDGSALLTASGGDKYSWTPKASLNDPNSANPIATPTQTTTYKVTVTDTNGCVNTDSAIVTVNELPSPNAQAGPDQKICMFSSTNLSAGDGVKYSWSPSTGLNDPAISNPLASPVQTTTYFVQVTDANGCSNVDSVEVTVLDLPVGSAGENVFNCPGYKTTLTASGGTSYEWLTTGDKGQSITVDPVTNTTYAVVVTDANGCKDTAQVNVDMYNIPVAGIKLISDSVFQGAPVVFADASSSGVDQWAWDFGDGTGSDEKDPVHAFMGSDAYTIELIVTDTNGCKDTTSLPINIFEGINVPNVFTPNGDGINDYFHIEVSGAGEYSLVIMNRWGSKMFETTDPNEHWDGKNLRGNLVSQGVYFYILKVTFVSGDSTESTGPTTMLQGSVTVK